MTPQTPPPPVHGFRSMWDAAEPSTRIGISAQGLAAISVVLQPWVPLWVWLTPIITTMGLVFWGLGIMQQNHRDFLEAQNLEAKWQAERERCRCR